MLLILWFWLNLREFFVYISINAAAFDGDIGVVKNKLSGIGYFKDDLTSMRFFFVIPEYDEIKTLFKYKDGEKCLRI